MGFGVALSYVSDVYKTVHKDNSEAQASEVGLGFNLGGSYYIYRDFGADVLDSEDDYFYMTLPGAGSNRLVKISGHFDDDGDYFAEYKTEEDSYARIIQISDAYGDVPSKFIVTTVDGTKYYFNHPRSTVVTLVDEIPSTDYIVSDEDMNWMDARAWCNVRGRSLACIGNSDDDLEAENKLGDNRVGWIGQYDSDGDGCWDDGCGTQSYQNWEPGHPEVECNDPYGNGNIYVIKDGDDGYWKDVNNPSSSYFAVCDRTIGGREAGTEKEYIYQWDLNLIEDVNGNKIYFSYHDESFEFKDKGYTKSYLDSISDSAGNSINIVWGTNLREDIFYGDIIDGEISPNTVKDHFVTDVITSSSAGGGISDWHFEYDYVNDNLHGNDSVNKKLVLTSLTRKGGDQTLPPFVFNYTDENDNPGIGYLERITYPAGAKVELGYEEKIIRGLITFVGDPGWEETSEDWGDRDTGDYYCDNFIWSPVECVNHGCKWEYNDCFMDQDTITGYRVNRKSIDDGLGNIEEITYSYENALLHLEKKRQKYIGHDSVTINYPEGFGYTIKNFCNDGGSTCASGAGCDEIASAKLDGYMYESRTYDDRGAVVASSDLRICPTITYLPPDDEPLGVIENPDFQEWTDEVPDGWTKVKSNSPSCSGYSLDEFILEDVQYGYVKMRTPRYLPECFYLKQDIDVEAGVKYHMRGYGRIKDDGYGYPNWYWKLEIYDGEEEIGFRRGTSTVWNEFYIYDLVSSSDSMEIRLYPHPSDIDEVDFDVWNDYHDLEIYRSSIGGDPDGVTYDLRVSSEGSTINGVSTSRSYENYDGRNGLPRTINENGMKQIQYDFAYAEYPGMNDSNMLSQVHRTHAWDGGSMRAGRVIWSNSSGVWRPYENYMGYGNEEQFISRINSYDNYGNVLEVEDADYHTTTTYYGDNGQCDDSGGQFGHSLPTCVKDHMGNEIRTHYTLSLNPWKIVDSNLAETKYSYDPFNRLYQVSSPDGGSVSNTYHYALDSCEYLSEENSECLNYVRSDSSVGRGNPVINIAYSDGLARNIQTRVLENDGSALVSNIEYNKISKISSITEPQSEGVDGFFGRIVYPLLGSFGDKLIRKEVMEYGEELRTSDQGSVKNFYYGDSLGRIKKVFPLTYYDADDEYLDDCLDAGCSYHSYSGATTTVTDLEGNNISTTVDSYGRVTYIKDEVSSMSYNYNSFGDLLSSSGGGLSITNEYNSLGQLIWSYNANTVEKSFEYATNGNLVKVYVYLQSDGIFGNEGSQEVLFTYVNSYDELNRIVNTTINGQLLLENTYDECYIPGQNYANGKVCKVDYYESELNIDGYTSSYGGTNSVEYVYDAMGRIVGNTETLSDGDIVFNSGYSYDSQGNLLSVTNSYSGGFFNTDYYYNSLGQLVRTGTPGGNLDYEYNALGLMKNVTYPNQIRADYFYNERNWPNELVIKDVDEEVGQTYLHEYYSNYDKVGNIKEISDSTGGATFTYDSAYRLEDFSGDYYGVGEVHYDLTSSGNRELRTVSQENDLIDSVDYEYSGNKLDSIDIGDDGSEDCSFDYGPSGNMVRKTCDGEITEYKYSAVGMLSRIDLPDGNVIIFGYDSLGRKVVEYSTVGRNKVVTYSYGEGINPLTEVECRWVDLTMDGAIDIADQAAYASCHNLMFSSPECIRADFNGDGIVGSQDWAIFGSFKGFPGDLLNDFDYCADETIPLRDIPFSEEEDQLCVGGECVPIP